MRLHRLIGIIMLLESRGIMKAGNLSKILETSERTIYRDIDILCEAGIPIMSIPGPNGGYSFVDGYKVNSGSFGSGDAVNILLSSMGIRAEKNTETAQQFKNAIIKLENSVSDEHKDEIKKARERFFIDADPWWGTRSENKYVDIIKESVLNLKKLKIYYKKYYGEISERIIRPYGVIVKNSEWYMAAFCESKEDIRVFKCSRIESIAVLDESFNMPKNFDLEGFWGDNKQQFITHTSQNKEHSFYPVKIKLFQEKNQLLDGFNVLSYSKYDNYWTYDIDMISFTTACNVIFPLSDCLYIIEPIELRNYVMEKVHKTINLYKAQ